MKSPTFSIIIPTLNEELFLPKLLASLNEQTNKDFEVIVVDGKSKDKTVAVATSYTEKISRLRVLTMPKGNQSAQRNHGAKDAKGDWLLFVDADSILMPYFLDRVRLYVSTHDALLCTTWSSSDSEDVNDAMVALGLNMYVQGSLLFHRPVAPGALFIVKKSLFDHVGGFSEILTWGEDYDLVKRITAQKIPLRIIPETLYAYSLRRFRREGKLKVIQMYLKATISTLITNQAFGSMQGYILGGAQYAKKSKKVSRSFIKTFQTKLKLLIKELVNQ